MPPVVLIGDSTLDNAAYAQGGREVISQVRAIVPSGWNATLLAVDGSTTDDVAGQLVGCRVTQRTLSSVSVETTRTPSDPRLGGAKIARVVVGPVTGVSASAPATRIVVR